MRSAFHLSLALILIAPVAVRAQTPPPVGAVVESSLKTGGGQIRQLAFDGHADSYFASAGNPGKDDHFTLIFDQPVAIRSIEVITGKPKGGDLLQAGILESSSDGKKFEKIADFADGIAHFKSDGVKIKALRVKPTADLKHPLAIREFKIHSEPKVNVFKYPIEFTVDASESPDLKEWAEKTARVCERHYAMINDELASEGFKPRTQITMTLKADYKGVAYASGGKIVGSSKYFKAHQDDVGAMIHETVHCVQVYRTRGPGWLVEGIADYVRFFKYEPGKIGKIAKDPHFDGSYRTTAAFLNFAAEKYDKELVKKINKSMREGEYREEMWKVLTKKTLKELDDEWRASMKKGATAQDVGPPFFRTHEILTGADAQELAATLKKTYAADRDFRIQPNPPFRLFVYANARIHAEIAAAQTPILTEEIMLKTLVAAEIIETLREVARGKPTIEICGQHNTIMVRGTADEIDTVRHTISVLEACAGQGSRKRV